jgi:ADP-ribose pyrophosphatase YjhB (NUDIX family)
MKYCSNCGAKVVWKIVPGEDRPRFFCEQCKVIHYTNPRVVAGVIPVLDGKILLCRRAIEPRHGKWTLPAGYLENGESVEDCARRETIEEACATLEKLLPYSMLNLPFINQIYFIYRAKLLNDDFRPGEESLDVQLFTPATLPWDDIAFPVISKVLEMYCHDLGSEHFPFREINVPAGKKI